MIDDFKEIFVESFVDVFDDENSIFDSDEFNDINDANDSKDSDTIIIPIKRSSKRKFRYQPGNSSLEPITPPAKLSGRSMIHDFTSKIVNKLSRTFNSNNDSMSSIMKHLCTSDCAVGKRVLHDRVPNSAFSNYSMSDLEEYLLTFKRVETEMPDMVFTMQSFRDYSSKSGLRIKCEYNYKGTFLKEMSRWSTPSPRSCEASTPTSVASTQTETDVSTAVITRIPVHCVGTLFIYLNNDNQITNLEFICRYL